MTVFVPARWTAIVYSLALLLSSPVLANHGPGASGGGSATISGETLKAGHYELVLREDYSQFEAFNAQRVAARARQGGDFDSLNHGFITTLDFGYGVTDDFQVGGSIGYFIGRDFRSASLQNDGSVEEATAQPNGLTDMVLLGKYRVLQGQPGNLAIVAGVKLPTGRFNVRLSNGEKLSPTDQPGSGAWDFPLGLGYSRFLTSQLTMDASVLYTFRTQRDGFKVGDRFDAGLALSYRLTEKIKTFPQYSVFTELNDVYLQKDANQDQSDPNSGSNTLYITPGFRVRFDPSWALTVAPSIPVSQEVNGDQGKVRFKLAISLSFSH